MNKQQDLTQQDLTQQALTQQALIQQALTGQEVLIDNTLLQFNSTLDLTENLQDEIFSIIWGGEWFELVNLIKKNGLTNNDFAIKFIIEKVLLQPFKALGFLCSLNRNFEDNLTIKETYEYYNSLPWLIDILNLDNSLLQEKIFLEKFTFKSRFIPWNVEQNSKNIELLKDLFSKLTDSHIELIKEYLIKEIDIWSIGFELRDGDEINNKITIVEKIGGNKNLPAYSDEEPYSLYNEESRIHFMTVDNWILWKLLFKTKRDLLKFWRTFSDSENLDISEEEFGIVWKYINSKKFTKAIYWDEK